MLAHGWQHHCAMGSCMPRGVQPCWQFFAKLVHNWCLHVQL